MTGGAEVEDGQARLAEAHAIAARQREFRLALVIGATVAQGPAHGLQGGGHLQVGSGGQNPCDATHRLQHPKLCVRGIRPGRDTEAALPRAEKEGHPALVAL